VKDYSFNILDHRKIIWMKVHFAGQRLQDFELLSFILSWEKTAPVRGTGQRR
jgi:hypothetical protein